MTCLAAHLLCACFRVKYNADLSDVVLCSRTHPVINLIVRGRVCPCPFYVCAADE